jgi:Ca-activated chloride channel family protein
MRFEYKKYDARQAAFEQRLKRITDLFNLLLNKAAGDADQALRWLDQVAKRHGLWDKDLNLETFKALLQKHGQLQQGERGKFELTGKGEAGMRQQALQSLFGDMQKSGGPGDHRSRHTGDGGERQPSVRPYEFGDELWNIAANDTIHNAVKSSLGRSPDAEQIEIREEDFAVHETEKNTQCATALLIDCSHSMVLYGEDRMTPARTTAMGLIEFIRNSFPRDKISVIAFGDDAVEVPLDQVPYLSWGPYHTNTKAALELGRKLLMRSRVPNRQIFLITDGKPTVLDEGGRRLIDSGWLNPQIVNRTLDEAAQCRRKRIPITTFMVTQDPYLMQFVEQLTEINHGRAYYTGLGKLGQYLLVDYVKNRKRSVR